MSRLISTSGNSKLFDQKVDEGGKAMCRLISTAFGALALLAAVAAAEPPSPAQVRQLQEKARRHQDAALKYLHADRPQRDPLAAALAEAQDKLAVERQLAGGKASAGVGEALALLGLIHLARDDFPQARQARQEEVVFKTEVYGPQHWQVTDARLALADVERWHALGADDRQRLGDAARCLHWADWHYHRADLRAARDAVQQAVRIRRKLLGDQHRFTAAGQSRLGALVGELGNYDEATGLVERSHAVLRAAVGEEHPYSVHCLALLARLRLEQGHEPEQAVQDLARAVQFFEQGLGKEHAEATTLLTSGGGLYGPLTEYAAALSHLGGAYLATNELTRAEPLLRQAAALQVKALEHLPPAYLKDLSYVGDYYYRRDDCVQTQHGRDVVLAYATCLNRLGCLGLAKGEVQEAGQPLREGPRLRQLVLGERHPVTAVSLTDLGRFHTARGEPAHASVLLWRAADTLAKAVGKAHPAYRRCLDELQRLQDGPSQEPAREERR